MVLKFKTAVVVLLALFLSGCMSMQVQQRLPKGARIGVISTYSNKANFKYVGTTVFQNKEYKHHIPVNLNSKVVQNISRTLQSNGYKPVIIKGVYINPKQDFVDCGFTKCKKNEFAIKLLARLKKQYKLNYLIVVQPYTASFGQSREDHVNSLDGYGIFYKSFLGIKAVYIAAGFNMYLFDVNSEQFWTRFGDVHKRTDAKLWKDNFAMFSRQDLRRIVSVLEDIVPNAISKNVKVMMQIY